MKATVQANVLFREGDPLSTTITRKLTSVTTWLNKDESEREMVPASLSIAKKEANRLSSKSDSKGAAEPRSENWSF